MMTESTALVNLNIEDNDQKATGWSLQENPAREKGSES
jgi:hypothetical protein